MAAGKVRDGIELVVGFVLVAGVVLLAWRWRSHNKSDKDHAAAFVMSFVALSACLAGAAVVSQHLASKTRMLFLPVQWVGLASLIFAGLSWIIAERGRIIVTAGLGLAVITYCIARRR
jgi:drug/metabolite transporter (DMT)-like permease